MWSCMFCTHKELLPLQVNVLQNLSPLRILKLFKGMEEKVDFFVFWFFVSFFNFSVANLPSVDYSEKASNI